MGKLGVQLFFLLRLYVAFNTNQTIFKIPLCVYIILPIIIILNCLYWIALLSNLSPIISNFQYNYIIATVIDLLITLILLYFFSNRLSKLLFAQKNDLFKKKPKHSQASSMVSFNSSSNNDPELTPVSPTSPVSEAALTSMTPMTPTTPASFSNHGLPKLSYNADDYEAKSTTLETSGNVSPRGLPKPNWDIYDENKSKMPKFGTRFNRLFSSSTNSKEPSNISREIASNKTTITMIKDNMNSRQDKLLFLITRSLILSLIALITTNILVLFIYIFNNYININIPFYWIYVLWSLDMAINSLCLFLNFSFTTDIYKLFCNKFHNCCQNCIKTCAALVIYKEIGDDIQMNSDINKIEMSGMSSKSARDTSINVSSS